MFEKVSTWLVSEGVHGPENRMRMFCFPHAGGTSNLFADWGSALKDTFEVFVINFPARDRYTSDQQITEERSFTNLISELVRFDLY